MNVFHSALSIEASRYKTMECLGTFSILSTHKPKYSNILEPAGTGAPSLLHLLFSLHFLFELDRAVVVSPSHSLVGQVS